MLTQQRKALASGNGNSRFSVIDKEQIRPFVILFEDAEENSDPPADDAAPPAGAGEDPPPANDESEDDELSDDTEDHNREPDPEAGYDALVKKQGGERAAGLKLIRENRSLRAARSTDRQEIQRLEASLPRGKKTVVDRAEVAQLQEFRALKLSPKQLRESLATLRSLQDAEKVTKREQTLATVAEITGFSLEALKHVGKDLNYVISGEGDNKEAKVRVKDAATNAVTEINVTDYADTNWSWAMQSLRSSTSDQQQRQQQQQRRAPQHLGPNGGKPQDYKEKVSGKVTSRYDSVAIPGVRVEKQG